MVAWEGKIVDENNPEFDEFPSGYEALFKSWRKVTMHGETLTRQVNDAMAMLEEFYGK